MNVAAMSKNNSILIVIDTYVVSKWENLFYSMSKYFMLFEK